jgi:hypothetical protein
MDCEKDNATKQNPTSLATATMATTAVFEGMLAIRYWEPFGPQQRKIRNDGQSWM